LAAGDGADGRVQAQYEAFPYPARDPADERKRLISGSPSHFDELNHYGFAGRWDFRRRLRALIAGGGTGDALIMLAQQLHDRGIAADLTYIDVSAASRAVAEARAAVRNLNGIRFLTGSLLEIGRLAPGPYDYIDCCGVLHHLAEPLEGLRALATELDPAGTMGLMLYGALGRTGVYPVQAALRALAGDSDDRTRIALARQLLADLPEGHWFKRNPYLGDHRLGDDAGLYDLLLHSRDRAYLVPEIEALAAAAGLRLVSFIEPARYDPATWLGNPALTVRARQLPWLQQCALAENLAGSIKSHVFYAVSAGRTADSIARPNGPEAIPVLRDGNGPALAAALKRGNGLTINFDGRQQRLAMPEGSAQLLALIDGSRRLGDLQRLLKLDWFALKARFDRVYALLNPLNLLLIRF